MTDQNTTPATTTRVKVTIAKGKLAASVVLLEPEAGEQAITVQEVLDALESAGVKYGVKQATIEEIVSTHEFGQTVEVAKGDAITRGTDAIMDFQFETVHEIKPTVDEDGRIDYRDMNFIRNVEQGAALIKKTPAQAGVNGKGVDGEAIVAPRGRDFPFKHGENTKVSEDGLELIASANGAIIFKGGKVSVKDMAVISGDVDFKVGNINCVGSVRITGTVRSGFEVIAGGNVEVLGDVENGIVEAAGDILIKGGCRGQDSNSHIKAGGDMIIKYAESQRLHSGKDIIVGGELINCQVSAKDNVWVKGRIGKIVGGEVRAGRQIRASVVGSDAGATTHLRVACDDDLLKKHGEAELEIKRLSADCERVKESLVMLYRLQLDGKLDAVRQATLEKLEDFQKDVPEALGKLTEQKEAIEEKLKEFKDSCIVIEKVAYPGVRVHFGIIYKDLEEEVRRHRLVLSGNQIVLAALENS